ncbi:MAG: hypothetical protein AAF618_03610 [Pseudomonadota bacterium]
MVGNSKVLTVSYGTFSCTLEGFDDSFDTMKAIAEYFRDLAAEDRYFGAEPPQPDAEVLARIAERELARSVEARREGSAVLLKPAVLDASDAPAPAAKVDEVRAEEERIAAEAEAARAEKEREAQAAREEEERQAQEARDEDARQAAEAEAARAEEEERLAEEARQEEERQAMAAEEKARQEEERAAAKAEAARQEEERAAREAEEAQKAQDAEAARAEEERKDTEADTARAEDELKEAEAARAEEPDAEEAASTEEDAPDAEEEHDAEDEDDAVGSKSDAPEQAAEAEDSSEAAIDETAARSKERGDSLAAKLRRIQAVVGAARAAKSAPASDTFTEDEHAEDFSKASEAAEVPEAAEAPDSQDAATDDAEMTREAPDAGEARPRVLKMKRADFEAAMAHQRGTEGDADAATAEAPGADAAAEQTAESAEAPSDADLAEAKDETAPREDAAEDDPEIESSLSPEDEADLLAELAAAEEAETEDAAQVETQDAADNASEEAAAARPIAQRESPDQTVGRLMDEADAQLDDPSAKSRRDAYSHLKAAVAAREAARSMGDEDKRSDGEREVAYRDDLAQVVRPRRAQTGSEARERPAAAPLKLVASQRVDLPKEDAAPAEPVRPRRVQAAAAPQPATPSNFGSFTAQAGATGLPDILEAAAAYTTHVDGNAVFTRPQVMRMIKNAMPDASFSREDGLRAFGTLLREGRIEKVRGGQFQVTEKTRYQPEARDMQAMAG